MGSRPRGEQIPSRRTDLVPGRPDPSRPRRPVLVRLRALSRLLIPRLLTTGSVVGAATAFRVGTGCLGVLRERTPPLVRLAVQASVGGADTERAQATFRDELIALARESSEVSWRELRRGVDDLDAWTRPRDQPANRRVRRPYRVKP